MCFLPPTDYRSQSSASAAPSPNSPPDKGEPTRRTTSPPTNGASRGRPGTPFPPPHQRGKGGKLAAPPSPLRTEVRPARDLANALTGWLCIAAPPSHCLLPPSQSDPELLNAGHSCVPCVRCEGVKSRRHAICAAGAGWQMSESRIANRSRYGTIASGREVTSSRASGANCGR